MSAETWARVTGWPYEVSTHGRIRSTDRTVVRSDGQRRTYKGITLKPGRMPTGHLCVILSYPGQRWTARVHRLVAAAFLGPCPEGKEVRHLDGNPANNDLSNLAYGTRSENRLDRVVHGVDHNARKTHCKRGHAFDDVNTYSRPEGGRRCRACKAIRERARKSR
jgi:hypothetical protein